jgi:serine/threonine protein kinase
MAAELRPGEVVAGRYRIIRPIGAGGMGAVYEAEQLTLGRTVALKVLFDDDDRALARFEQEARSLARISHPNVVGVYEFHRADADRALLVMELLDGEPLSAVLRREGRFEPARAAAIAEAVLSGLEATHERGIVHRDLKPSNIILTRDGGLKIVDFGIAKVLDSPNLHTTLGSVVGTPSYLSPEQLRGEPPDGRTDLHALGVCLYELLVGKKPWRARAAMDLAAEILRDSPPSVRTVRPDVPRQLSDVIDCALAKERGARFANAKEMKRALRSNEAIVLDVPTATSPQPSPRPPWLIIVVSTGLFFAVLGLVVAMATTGKLTKRPTAGPAGPRVYGPVELANLQGTMPLDGEEIHGVDCDCLPVEVVTGKVTQARALECPRCAGVAVDGSWRCSGADESGRAHEGRYFCGLYTMGPRVPSAGTKGPAQLK